MLAQSHITLIFACISTLSAGTNYVFSGYSPQLQAKLHLSSTQLNLVAASGNAGVYLSGPILGLLVDRKGPRLALLIAAVCLFLGYYFLRVIYEGGFEGIFQTCGVAGLSLASFSTGWGSSSALSASINGVTKSFPSNTRGGAIATTISCFGLSAFFYSTLGHYLATREDPTATFLSILSIGTGISMLLGAFFVIPTLHAHSTGIETPSRGEYFPIESPDQLRSLSQSPPNLSTSRTRESSAAEDDLEARSHRPRRDSKSKESKRENLNEIDVSGWEFLTNRDAWLMMIYLGLCSGIGLMYINNCGTIIATLLAADESDSRAPTSIQAYLVGLLSICNCLGRLALGFASDFSTFNSLSPIRFPRIYWYIPIASLFVISQILASFVTKVSQLTLPTILIGFAYGALFAASPVVCVERFGVRNLSTNNGYLTLAPSVFAAAANALFGLVYDSKVTFSHPHENLLKRAAETGSDHLCHFGAECFRTAFGATTIMAILAIGVGIVLSRRKTMLGADFQ